MEQDWFIREEGAGAIIDGTGFAIDGNGLVIGAGIGG